MLVKCSECGQDISTDAKRCPHCGAKNKAGKQIKRQTRAKKYLKFWLYAFLIFFGIGTIGSFLPKEKKAEEAAPEEIVQPLPRENVSTLTDETAYEYAKDIVREDRKKMRNMTGLHFPDIKDKLVIIAVSELQKRYVVTGYYDKPKYKRWQVKIFIENNSVKYSDLRYFD